MAAAWLAVGPALALAGQGGAPQADPGITVTAANTRANRLDATVTYSGDVTVTYDVTRIRADKVTLYLASTELELPILTAFWAAGATSGMYMPSFDQREAFGLSTRRGIAEGNVVLTDPIGTIRASRIEFNLTLKTGHADQVLAEVAGVTIRAAEARVAPGRYELLDASGTSCPELYSLATRRVVIRPGEKAVIERPRFSLGPLRLPALPNQTISLDQRVTGFRLPGISYKRDEGLGITWGSGILLDAQTALTAGFNIFPSVLPTYGIEVARSSVPPSRATGLISPRSELGERFSYGYFENVSVRSPESESAYLASPRNTLSAGSYWNQTATSRAGDSRFSKALDVAYERGGRFGAFGAVAQARAQYVRENDGPFKARIVGSLAAGPKPVPLGGGLYGHLRLNAQGLVGGDSLFGWVRLQVGAIYRPVKQVSIGGVFNFAAEAGDPIFELDRLYSTNSFHFRGDIALGPARVSLLGKYDLERKKWYDREYAISLIAGCVEPYVLWREFPSDYRLGLRLRIDKFLELVSKRDIKR